MCSLENNIHRVLAPIDTFLQKTDADILKKYSVEKYLGLYSGSVNLLSYGYVGSELNKCLTRICNNYGSCVYNHYQKAVILKAMLISLKRFDVPASFGPSTQGKPHPAFGLRGQSDQPGSYLLRGRNFHHPTPIPDTPLLPAWLVLFPSWRPDRPAHPSFPA
jgi:hypothetical protein